MPDHQLLSIERRGHVATVTFRRAEKANALNYDLMREIERAALDFRDDVDARVVIFTGAGKHFTSGADLTDASSSPATLLARRRRARMGERVIRALLEMDQITIAAWNGAAMGGGACIVAALDLRVGAEDCFMQFPEIDIGMNLMWQSLPLVTRLVGAARAKRMVIGGERVFAADLETWGVLDRRVPGSELLNAAHAMADTYAAKPPIAAQMIKRSINRYTGALDEAVMHMDADQNLLTQTTEDRRRAARAYLDETKAEFEGD